MRRLTTLLLSVAVIAGVHLALTSTALACSAPIGRTDVSPIDGLMTIPLEGVIVFAASDRSGGSPVTVVVRNSTGEEIAGSQEIISVASGNVDFLGDRSSTQILVWRADAPLEPATPYAVDVVNDGDLSLIDGPLELTTTSEPFEGLSETVELRGERDRRALVSANFSLSCTSPGGGECPTCEIDDMIEVTTIHRALPTEYDDAFTVHRLVPETGAPITREATMWLEDLGGKLHYPIEADEYCFHLESESLIDGTIVEGPSECVPAADITPLPVDPDPVDPMERETSSRGGCSATDAGGHTLPPSLTALCLLLFAARRRRA